MISFYFKLEGILITLSVINILLKQSNKYCSINIHVSSGLTPPPIKSKSRFTLFATHSTNTSRYSFYCRFGKTTPFYFYKFTGGAYWIRTNGCIHTTDLAGLPLKPLGQCSIYKKRFAPLLDLFI